MKNRDIDTPNLPFNKPAQIERLEKMSFDQREAMDKVEVEEHLQDAADSIAIEYRKRGGDSSDYDGCILVLESALSEMGGSFGGKMGAFIVGSSNRAARRACRRVFPSEDAI